ncbi:MAG TPA: ATP-binding protein [Usitatibacter sp.]|nr:ATP-binding protein [Usitatibacter sp.]
MSAGLPAILSAPRSAPGRQAFAYLAFGAVYYLLAAYAAHLPFHARLPLFIWPAHGLALGVLLVVAPRRWWGYLAIVFAASIAVGLQRTDPWTSILATAALNCAQPLAVGAGLIRLAGPRVRIDTVRGVSAFLVGMVPLVAAMALLDAALGYSRLATTFRNQWSVTFVSTMLGMLLTAPLILAWSRSGARDATEVARRRWPELVALYAGLIVTASYVFGARARSEGFIPSLAYLCAPFLIWAALSFGLRAATLGLSIFGLIVYWNTGQSLGPLTPGGTPDVRALLHLQGYLATLIVTTLFAAALLVERREAARETEAWRNRHEAVIRASGNLLYEFDPAQGGILWDGDTVAVLGTRREHISTIQKWVERVHPDDRMRLKGLRRMLATGDLAHVALEYRFRRDDGEYTTVGVNAYRIGTLPGVEGSPRRVIGFVKDVSEKVRAEEERQRLAAQLRQAEKMQAVGHLAGGIAHDFNNILGAILGYGELAQMKAEGDMRRYIDTIMSAGNRAKALVAQILSYSRAEGSERLPVIVAPIAQEVCDLIQGSSPETIEVRYEGEAAEAAVLGDPTRIHQLLMNLCTNAVQAMGDKGVLEVRVEQESVSQARKVRTGEIAAGEYVKITVRDTGHGIAPEVIDRIFEPFFTTKPAGRGTGLGLALVHAVVMEHRGFLEVSSELGRGTTFEVWMPLVHVEAGKPEPAHALPMGQGQSILAVDDEPEVLAALEEMLASLGYEPVGYTDSREALAAARADPRRFDAVVSDEVMSQLTGTQLAIELRKLNPTLPIVIASGYGGAGFETRALSAGVNRVLKKPYRMSDIGEALASFFTAA